MHRTTEIAAGLCHMGTTGVRRPECRSINPAGIQICHARENRRGISGGTWTMERDVEGREGEGNEPMHSTRNGGRERDEERGLDAVGGPRRRRVNTEAPRRFTTPRYHGRCLTYPRLSGTQAIFTGRVTTTRATSPRDACRDALRGAIAGRNVVQNCKHVFKCRTM